MHPSARWTWLWYRTTTCGFKIVWMPAAYCGYATYIPTNIYLKLLRDKTDSILCLLRCRLQSAYILWTRYVYTYMCMLHPKFYVICNASTKALDYIVMHVHIYLYNCTMPCFVVQYSTTCNYTKPCSGCIWRYAHEPEAAWTVLKCTDLYNTVFRRVH